MSESFKFTGTIVSIGETQQVTDSFKKREIVLSDNADQYPQEIMFQFAQDKCSLADNLSVGSTITIAFNLRGRSWTSPQGEVKYFNTLDAWRVEGNVENGKNNTANVDSSAVSKPSESSVSTDEEDDLPF